MSHLGYQSSEWNEGHNNRPAVSIDDTAAPPHLPNILTGIVISKQEGLTRTTVRIRVGERADLRARWPASSPAHGAVDIGQTVRLTIPTEAVQLEAGGFRRSKQRWNRWIGRIVLVGQSNREPVLTVKVYRDTITLKSLGPVIGASAPLTTWDTVNIVVDPQRVQLTPLSYASTMEAPSRFSAPARSAPTSVWLRATIRSVRSISSGQLVALNIGGVPLAAIIETSRAAMSAWTAGASVEINIGHCDAWIRRCTESPLLPCCVVLSSEFGNPRLSVPIRRTDT